MRIPIKYQTNIDFNECPLSIKNGMYGGMAGNKDGIIYNGSNWMVKYPKNTKSMNNVAISYTTAPLCEFIGSHIYSLMGYDVHETLLGERNGKIVVACKDFENESTRLVEMRTIKNYASKELSEILERDFSSTGDRHFVLLDEMLLYLKESDILNSISGIQERFWDMTVVDMFIGNSDRNNGNWGILRKSGVPDTLAPIFDNGGCFSDKMDNDRYLLFLNNPDKMKQAATNYRTTFGYIKNGVATQLNAKQLINMCLSYEGFRLSFIKNYEKYQEAKQSIFAMIEQITPELNNKIICTDIQKKYFKELLSTRENELLKPTYELIVKLSKEQDFCDKEFDYDD